MESTLHQPFATDFRVIETLRFDPQKGFLRLGLHLDRAEKTCRNLNIVFDRAICLQTLGEAVDQEVTRCRLTISGSGVVDVTVGSLQENAPVWYASIFDKRLESSDMWLRYKTTNRELYESARANMPDGRDEVLFLNERGEICEGTITNVFAEIDGTMYTPPTRCGLLPGVLRQELLEAGIAQEGVLKMDDLLGADKLWVGNSLRGLIPLRLV